MTSFLGESIPGILAENKGEPVTGQCLSADTSRHVTRKVLSLLENHDGGCLKKRVPDLQIPQGCESAWE